MRYILFGFSLVFLWAGCSKNVDQPPSVETFQGSLFVYREQEPTPDIDDVIFTVEGSEYNLNHLTSNSGLCSSGGRVDNFGSNRITLTPVYVLPSSTNCDSLHIPKGVFNARFQGDSLILGPNTITYDTGASAKTFTFHFLLTK